jgi:hypothetical protein
LVKIQELRHCKTLLSVGVFELDDHNSKVSRLLNAQDTLSSKVAEVSLADV